MLGELLEHVIEESDASRDMSRFGRIEGHGHLDARFLRAPLHMSPTGRQGAHNFRPRLFARSMTAYTQASNPEVGGELQIRIAVADDRTRGQIHRTFAHEGFHERRPGFAAGAIIRFEMRTNEDSFKLAPLGADGLENELLRTVSYTNL